MNNFLMNIFKPQIPLHVLSGKITLQHHRFDTVITKRHTKRQIKHKYQTWRYEFLFLVALLSNGISGELQKMNRKIKFQNFQYNITNQGGPKATHKIRWFQDHAHEQIISKITGNNVVPRLNTTNHHGSKATHKIRVSPRQLSKQICSHETLMRLFLCLSKIPFLIMSKLRVIKWGSRHENGYIKVP